MRERVQAALATWAGDPVLAAPLADSARVVLVLDGAATTVLHASAAAAPFRDAVSDAAGILTPWLAGQIRAVGVAPRPRLVRLRLDPRRIAPPTACLIAGGTIEGAPALLLVVAGPLPVFRPRPGRVAAAPDADRDTAPAAPAAEAAPTAGDRFVWRSDAADRLTTISGSSFDALAPRLVGQSWPELAEAGRLGEADAFLSALKARRTFRALPAALDLGAAGTLALDLSGAGLGRSGDVFSGFGGYGVVRGVTVSAAANETETPPNAPPAPPAATDAHPVPSVASPDAGAAEPAVALPEADGSTDVRALPDTRRASWPPALVTVARFGDAWTGFGHPPASRGTVAAAEPGAAIRIVAPVDPAPATAALRAARERPVATQAATADAASSVQEQAAADAAPSVQEAADPASSVQEQEAADAALSVTEHAAFREIARALGARYAGDEEDGDIPDEAGGARGETGAVMPFPAPRAVEPEGPSNPKTLAPPLDDLPVALLIHRGDAVLAANRRLLALTGHSDLASLQATGLGRLFRGLPPDVHEPSAEGADAVRVVETAQGGSRPVAVERGAMAWAGAPAACLILRAVAEADPAREQAAERLAQSFRDAHAADARATLDALDDGVVTLDTGARIVAMNRAAAALFACDPREVVGTGFDALFEASQRDAVRAVRAGVAGLGTETRIAAGGRPLMLRVSGQDGTRVAVLRAPADETARTGAGFDRPAFLTRLDREIRTPVEGIVGLADGILAEPHGPIDERYRGTLRAIRAAGDHVRGLVSDLIDLATIESGGLALTVRPLPLNDLVSGCVELLQPEAARGRIVLRTSFSPDLAPLEADEPSLRQAALTVIGDAIRATGAGGQVIVSTAPGERGGVALKVRGTGPGPRSAEAEGTPDPRDGDDPHDPGLGTPLTKALTRALVEANHGRLHVSSRGNDGTLVEILLPGLASRTA